MAKETDKKVSEGCEGGPPSEQGAFGFSAIERLAELMQEHGLEEVDVFERRGKDWKTRIRLSKTPSQRTVAVEPARPAPPAAAPAPVQDDPGPASDPAEHPGVVLAPMIGTVYLQPQPGTPKFVEVGSAVAEGQTLLIIEAMKTMNPINASHAGTVRRILVEDTSIVEYGTPLMIID